MRKIMFFLFLTILLSTYAFGQKSIYIWQYKDNRGNTWSNWNNAEKYITLNYTGADSLISRDFNLGTDFNGYITIYTIVDTISGPMPNLKFRIHTFDGFGWIEHENVSWDVMENYKESVADSNIVNIRSVHLGKVLVYRTFLSSSSIHWNQYVWRSFRIEAIWDGAINIKLKQAFFYSKKERY